MYLQDWVENPYPLPTETHEEEPTGFVLHILRRPDAAGQGLEVPEYFAKAAEPHWGNRPNRRGRLPEEDLAIDSQEVSSDSTGSSKKG